MTFKGTITPELFQRSVALQTRATRIGAVFFAVVAVLNFVFYFRPLHEGRSGSIFPALFSLAFALFLWFGPAVMARRAYRNSKALQGELSGEATPTGIAINSKYGGSVFPWDVFQAVLIKNDLAMLYFDRYQAHLIAREFFATPEDWTAFQKVVTENVPPKKRFGLSMIALFFFLALFLVLFGWIYIQALNQH